MKKRVYAMVANGTEEAELLNVVDLLRRAGIEVVITSVDGATVTSSHGVRLIADALIDSVDLTDADMIFVPGGMPGSKRLADTKKLIDAIGKMLDGGKRVAAICAAPALVLGAHGFLNGKKATCFPGFEAEMRGASVTGGRVETDGLVTTAQGLGCALELGLEIIALLLGKSTALSIKEKICF